MAACYNSVKDLIIQNFSGILGLRDLPFEIREFINVIPNTITKIIQLIAKLPNLPALMISRINFTNIFNKIIARLKKMLVDPINKFNQVFIKLRNSIINQIKSIARSFADKLRFIGQMPRIIQNKVNNILEIKLVKKH